MGLLVYEEATAPPAKKMAIPSAEFVESLNVAGLISLLQETKDKFQTQNINGKAFLLLTRQELKDELKLPVGDYVNIENFIKKLNSQEEDNVDVDEVLSRELDSYVKISEISTATPSGTGASTATLSVLCKNKVILKDDRLYY